MYAQISLLPVLKPLYHLTLPKAYLIKYLSILLHNSTVLTHPQPRCNRQHRPRPSLCPLLKPLQRTPPLRPLRIQTPLPKLAMEELHPTQHQTLYRPTNRHLPPLLLHNRRFHHLRCCRRRRQYSPSHSGTRHSTRSHLRLSTTKVRISRPNPAKNHLPLLRIRQSKTICQKASIFEMDLMASIRKRLPRPRCR